MWPIVPPRELRIYLSSGTSAMMFVRGSKRSICAMPEIKIAGWFPIANPKLSSIYRAPHLIPSLRSRREPSLFILSRSPAKSCCAFVVSRLLAGMMAAFFSAVPITARNSPRRPCAI